MGTVKTLEAHLLCDVELRPISVTQSKLLRARQRPAENTQSAHVGKTNKPLKSHNDKFMPKIQRDKFKTCTFHCSILLRRKEQSAAQSQKISHRHLHQWRKQRDCGGENPVGVEQQSAKYELL